MATIGFVGLGQMGSRMVKRLLDAHYTVIGYNRTKSKAEALISQGMQWADTPTAATQTSDIIITNVTDGNALQHVAIGILASIQPGSVWIDMSTVSPTVTRELAAQAADKGATVLDAPVSGSKLTLEQGNLTIMVAGDEATVERVRPILEVIGPKVIYIGASGQAMALKLAINISVATQILNMAEGVLLAEKYGIPREKTVEVMLNSAIASPAMKYRGPFLVNMPDEAWFDVDMMQKDIRLALEVGREIGVALHSTALMSEILSQAQARGLAEKDFAVIYQVLQGQR